MSSSSKSILTNPINLPSLKMLKMAIYPHHQHVQLLETLIASSPLLEDLSFSVTFRYYIGFLRKPGPCRFDRITISHQNLKRLKISLYETPNEKKIVIKPRSLEYFSVLASPNATFHFTGEEYPMLHLRDVHLRVCSISNLIFKANNSRFSNITCLAVTMGSSHNWKRRRRPET